MWLCPLLYYLYMISIQPNSCQHNVHFHCTIFVACQSVSLIDIHIALLEWFNQQSSCPYMSHKCATMIYVGLPKQRGESYIRLFSLSNPIHSRSFDISCYSCAFTHMTPSTNERHIQALQAHGLPLAMLATYSRTAHIKRILSGFSYSQNAMWVFLTSPYYYYIKLCMMCECRSLAIMSSVQHLSYCHK